MSLNPEGAALDWDAIKLAVFDVDGTLYDQRGLRLQMLGEMLMHAARARRIEFIKILRAYRHIREELGERPQQDFERVLIQRTSAATGCSEEQVRATAAEWLEQRPLRHLLRYRFAHLPQLFASLRQRGKIIGVFSDYPARDKLAALKLDADFIVCATDADVSVLKPHAKGLQILMARAGVEPSQTVLIGDRPERDGLAARAAHARSLILSRKAREGWQTFERYDDPVFAIDRRTE